MSNADAVNLLGKSIIGIENFSAEEIRLVLDTAYKMKQVIRRGGNKKLSNLRGKAIVSRAKVFVTR